MQGIANFFSLAAIGLFKKTKKNLNSYYRKPVSEIRGNESPRNMDYPSLQNQIQA